MADFTQIIFGLFSRRYREQLDAGVTYAEVVGTVMGPVKTTTVTIADTASLSSSFDLSGARVALRITCPAGMEGTSLTFACSDDNDTFVNAYDKYGIELTFTVAASRSIVLTEPALFAGARYWKIRTGTSGTPSTQTGAAILTIAYREM
jgi:hypothetical protein